jgi:glutamate/tyrosine decarboxylase-like PLP-dependent enzyme
MSEDFKDLAGALKRLADHALGHAARGEDAPAFRRAEKLDFGPALPDHGRPLAEALDVLLGGALPHGMDTGHRRFFAFIPAPASPVSWLGELAVQIHNPHLGAALQSEGATAIERGLIRLLCDAAGFPEDSGGLFVSGGSMANLTALVAARDRRLADEERPLGVAYVTGETHSSVAKSLRISGFLDRQIRLVVTDDSRRMNVSALAGMVAADRAEGKKPFAVVASAGTTNTGAIDPLPEIADLCSRENLWMHVDGAYGASALFSPEHRHLLAGIERADSIAWDAHKWLFQTYGCGMTLVRDASVLAPSFALSSVYLRDGAAEGAEPNYWDLGPELTRPARAVRLWLTFQAMGREGVAAAIAHGFALAETAERLVRGMDGWRVVSPAQMAITAFRYAPEGLSADHADTVNAAAARRLTDEGFAVVGTTRIDGRLTIRLCTINPATTKDDLEATLRRLDALAREIAAVLFSQA